VSAAAAAQFCSFGRVSGNVPGKHNIKKKDRRGWGAAAVVPHGPPLPDTGDRYGAPTTFSLEQRNL